MQEDVELAVEKFRSAQYELERTILLPEGVGSRIVWNNNGIIWERTGGNTWIPVEEDEETTAYFAGRTWPSKHLIQHGLDFDIIKVVR
jgi:hypothetical protein